MTIGSKPATVVDGRYPLRDSGLCGQHSELSDPYKRWLNNGAAFALVNRRSLSLYTG
jgi:hypothetical protein